MSLDETVNNGDPGHAALHSSVNVLVNNHQTRIGTLETQIGADPPTNLAAETAARIAADAAALAAANATFETLTGGAAKYVPGVVGAPTGGDDAALLKAALTGTKDIYLQPGATYVVSSNTAWPAFTGTIFGRGATIRFTFGGPYVATPAITTWVDVECVDLKFTGSPLFGGIFGEGCARLTFRKCGVYDLGTAFALPIDSDLAIYDSRWYESGSPPATVNQTVQGPHGGKYIVKDNDFNFAPTGVAGAILGTISTVPVQGASVHINDNKFLDKDLAGYTIDAVIDIEPSGNVPYDLVDTSGNTIYNSTIYASSAARINVHKNRYRYTARNGAAPRMVPVSIYNNHGTQPATGVVDIADNEVTQDDVAGAYDTHFWKSAIPVKEIRSRNNKVKLNVSTTGAVACYEVANTSERVIIDGDRIENSSATTFASRVLAKFTFLPSKSIEIRRMKANGKWFSLISSETAGAQTCPLMVIEQNDLLDLVVNGGAAPGPVTYIYNDGNGTFTNKRIRNNPGLNPSNVRIDPAFPASTVAVTNTSGFDVTAIITNGAGAITGVAMGGTATGLTIAASATATLRIPAGQSVTFTYASGTPTWAWIPE